MAKVLDFQDFSAKVKDKDGDVHESTVRAAVVTEDTAREVVTPTGARWVNPGDVVVATDRPDVFDVHSEDSWKATGYGKARTSAARKTASAKVPADKTGAASKDS